MCERLLYAPVVGQVSHEDFVATVVPCGQGGGQSSQSGWEAALCINIDRKKPTYINRLMKTIRQADNGRFTETLMMTIKHTDNCRFTQTNNNIH